MNNVSEDSIKSFPIIHHEDEDVVDVKVEVEEKSKKTKTYKKDDKNNGKFGFNKKTKVINTATKSKIQALFKAQEELISNCLPSKSEIEDIKLSLSHVEKWEGKRIYIDTSDDEIKIKHKNKNYIFSKKQFFSNNKFKFNLVKKYNNILNSSVWVNIKEKEIQDVNHHIITIKKKY